MRGHFVILGMKTTSDVWIHVAVWFVILLGIYYTVSACIKSKVFVRTTVYGRLIFIVFLGVLVALGLLSQQ